MKKLMLPLLLAFALFAGGCAQLRAVQDVVTGATATTDNPVTKARLKAVEDGAIIAFAALGAYKKTCEDRVIPPSCRTVIQSIQVYTIKLQRLLPVLRNYVKNNDQVNAIIAYNTVRELITAFRNEAVASGVPLPQ